MSVKTQYYFDTVTNTIFFPLPYFFVFVLNDIFFDFSSIGRGTKPVSYVVTFVFVFYVFIPMMNKTLGLFIATVKKYLYTYIYIYIYRERERESVSGYNGGCPRGVMVKTMDCGIVVSEFVLQSHYYVHFQANTLGKGMNPLILPAMG